jgi:hypothetical protein
MMEMPVPLIGVMMPKVVDKPLLTVLITTNVPLKNVSAVNVSLPL